MTKNELEIKKLKSKIARQTCEIYGLEQDIETLEETLDICQKENIRLLIQQK